MTHTLAEKMKRVETLKNLNGIQAILNEAYKILGNPIVMFDTEYRLIYSTEGIITDDPIWNEIIESGGFCLQTQELFKKEGFIDAVANAETLAFLLSFKLKYDRILGKLFNENNNQVASLVIVACHRDFETEDPVVFEAICKVVSVKIGSCKFFKDYEKTYDDTLIKKLISGNIADKGLHSARVAILYNGLEENLFLAVLDAGKCKPAPVNLEQLRDLLLQEYPAYKYSIHDNNIVIIISSASHDIKQDLQQLEEFCRQRDIYAGISSCFENLFELPRYYAEATLALKNGLLNNNDHLIFLSDGMC